MHRICHGKLLEVRLGIMGVCGMDCIGVTKFWYGLSSKLRNWELCMSCDFASEVGEIEGSTWCTISSILFVPSTPSSFAVDCTSTIPSSTNIVVPSTCWECTIVCNHFVPWWSCEFQARSTTLCAHSSTFRAHSLAFWICSSAFQVHSWTTS